MRALALAVLLAGCAGEPTPAPTPRAAPVATPARTPAPTPLKPTAVAPEDSGIRLGSVQELPEGTREQAMTLLRSVVEREAGDPANAWALAHGLLAMGKDFRTTDGRLARDVLVADFLEEGPSFPTKRGDVRVEPHEDLILKSLIESGVGLDEPIGAGGPELSALVAASQAAFTPVNSPGATSLFPSGNDAPWSVQAWCQAAAAGASSTWSAKTGDADIDAVAGSLMALLEKETYPIRVAASKRAPVQKNKQDIFKYTCGGAHLFQGVEACLAAGYPAVDSAKKRFQALAGLYLYRVPSETAMVDAALQTYPQLAILLLNQDVKFLGHLLESLGKAQRDGLWTPKPNERKLLDDAEARLLQDVVQLGKLGAYGAEEMKTLASDEKTFQMYLDLVGDAGHAWRGLAVQAELEGG